MRKADMQAGADVYYVAAASWRLVSPTKATIVDPAPHRIIRQRCGAIYLVSYVPDPKGTAVVVDVHEGTRKRRTAVPARHLRGLWKETLAATGRTEAGHKAHEARVHALATSGREITPTAFLGLLAQAEGVDDATVTVAAEVLLD